MCPIDCALKLVADAAAALELRKVDPHTYNDLEYSPSKVWSTCRLERCRA